MKKIFQKIFLVIGMTGMFAMYGCDDFLTIEPEDRFSDENFWSSEANLELYSWQFYETFLGYGNGTSTSSDFYFQFAPANGCMHISDDLANATFLKFNESPSTTSSQWNAYYADIRSINVMLAKLPLVPMSEEARLHWESVGRFFRAYSYYKLVQRYGDVPYVDEAAQVSDQDKIYVPRTSRDVVMGHVIEDLQFAASENMRLNNGANRVNRYTAYALLSQVALFEGTFAKYHNTAGDVGNYLTIAKNAADEVIKSGKFTIGTEFKAIYNSLDLSGNSEVILYKKYLPSIGTHSVQAYTNTSSIINGMTKFAADSYVYMDGLPQGQSDLDGGDESIEDVFANRDPRFAAVVDSRKYGYADSPSLEDLYSSTGYVIHLFNDWEWGEVGKPGAENITGGQNHVDAPIFTYSEVLLNYAEACAELGNCTQADLDKSVNVIREYHASLPKLVVSGDEVSVNGVVINDPKRISALETIDNSTVVSPLIWEIRRERRAELMAWTEFRYYDLMRWHRGHYMDSSKNPDVALGAKITDVSNLVSTTVNEDGYISPYAATRTFNPAKHYLNSIPTKEITLYEAEGVELTQNPGWE